MYINYFYIKFITFFNRTYINSHVKFEVSRITNVIPNKINTNNNVKTSSTKNTVFWLNIYQEITIKLDIYINVCHFGREKWAFLPIVLLGAQKRNSEGE